VLATLLGTSCVLALVQRKYGVMMALQNGQVRAVPLEQVAGRKKLVPANHPLVQSAKMVGTCFGD